MPLTLVSRNEWTPIKPDLKKKDENLDETLKHPVRAVIVKFYTRTPGCLGEKECKAVLRKMLNYHMVDLDYTDVKYNFLIGGDGTVYEGRGWFTKPYLDDQRFKDYLASVVIALVGDFKKVSPPEAMTTAVKNLIDYGVKSKFIHPDYEYIENRTDTVMPYDPGYLLSYSDEHNFEEAPY